MQTCCAERETHTRPNKTLHKAHTQNTQGPSSHRPVHITSLERVDIYNNIMLHTHSARVLHARNTDVKRGANMMWHALHSNNTFKR